MSDGAVSAELLNHLMTETNLSEFLASLSALLAATLSMLKLCVGLSLLFVLVFRVVFCKCLEGVLLILCEF